MDNEESPNAQLKQRITELRQLLEKKKRKLQTSLQHSERGDGGGSGPKRVRFSEPVSSPPLCSQNLFDDDDNGENEAMLAAALSESGAALPCDVDAAPPSSPSSPPPLLLSTPCCFQPAAAELVLRGPDAFLCLRSARQVQVFSGVAAGPESLLPLWSRTAPHPTFLHARLLPGGPNLVLAEVIDDAVHVFCLEFHDRRLHSAYPLCILTRAPNLLSCGRSEGPILLLASSPDTVHAALIAHEDRVLRSVHRWERHFAVPCAVPVTSSSAVVVAQHRGRTQLGLLRLEDGAAEFFPAAAAQPRSVQLLHEEASFCFIGGLEGSGTDAAAFLLCFCPATLQLRRVRAIPLAPAALPPEVSPAFWVDSALLWGEESTLQLATLDWAAGTCARQAQVAAGVDVLPVGDRWALCVCRPQTVTLCLPPVSSP